MYRALRTFKVQGDDGVMRLAKPGDLVPEAAGWRKVQSYINRGWIERSGQAPQNSAPSGDATVAIKNASAAPSPEPEPAVEPATEAESPLEPEAEPEKLPSKSKLGGMAKSELQAMAEDMGLNPDQSKSKIVSAIMEAR